MGLKQCLLEELTQSEDGSGVTISGSDYDENLYMSLKTFWDLFSAGQFTTMVTCTTCGTISITHEPFSELMLPFPQPHHENPHKYQKLIYKIKLLLIVQISLSVVSFNLFQIL